MTQRWLQLVRHTAFGHLRTLLEVVDPSARKPPAVTTPIQLREILVEVEDELGVQ